MISYCRLYISLIDQKFECDVYFPNLQEFGLKICPSPSYTVKNMFGLKLVDFLDQDVDTDIVENENGTTWRYKVLEFVNE